MMKRGYGTAGVLLATLGLAACQDTAMDEPIAMRTGSSVTENACLSAVASQANNGDVAVISSEFSQANTLVMVGVGQQRAPWRCLVSNDGVVQEVYFAGSEGAL